MLSTAGRIKDGDADGWVREWCAAAERLEADAQRAEGDGQLVSARNAYLRAANYFSTGLYLITHSSAPERQLDIWTRHRACWDKFVDLAPVPGERLQIPYEGTTLPGYFFRVQGAEPGERRPLVVLNNGSDGATSHIGLFGGWAALERGYHAMTFDGPGQQAALFRQGIPFRHDWEAVLTPVVDAMAARPDVDPDRIALIGVSQAGYWVPRALAFEHRFVAAVADPGVVDVSTSWMQSLPGFMRSQLQDPSKKESFDKEMGWTERFSRSTRATLHFRGEPYQDAVGAAQIVGLREWLAFVPGCGRRCRGRRAGGIVVPALGGAPGHHQDDGEKRRPDARQPPRRPFLSAGSSPGWMHRHLRVLLCRPPTKPRFPSHRRSGKGGLPAQAVHQRWSGRLAFVNSAPCAAREPDSPPPRPLSTNATPTARVAPISGPATYTQYELKLAPTASGPKVRAGFIDAPEIGLAHRPASAT